MSHTFIHAYVNLGVLPFVWEKETGHLLLYHQDEVYITYWDNFPIFSIFLVFPRFEHGTWYSYEDKRNSCYSMLCSDASIWTASVIGKICTCDVKFHVSLQIVHKKFLLFFSLIFQIPVKGFSFKNSDVLSWAYCDSSKPGRSTARYVLEYIKKSSIPKFLCFLLFICSSVQWTLGAAFNTKVCGGYHSSNRSSETYWWNLDESSRRTFQRIRKHWDLYLSTTI